MFTATLFIIAKSWKQPKCPSARDQINQLRYSHKIDYYIAAQKMSKRFYK